MEHSPVILISQSGIPEHCLRGIIGDKCELSKFRPGNNPLQSSGYIRVVFYLDVGKQTATGIAGLSCIG